MRNEIRACCTPLTQGLNNLIHQPHLLGFVSLDGLARQHHVQGGGDGQQARQPLGAASPRQQSQHDFRHTEACLLVSNRNAVMACQRYLKHRRVTKKVKPP